MVFWLSQRARQERKISDVHAQIVKIRKELDVLSEQMMVFADDADESRVQALVSESTADQREWRHAKGHAEIYAQRRTRLLAQLEQLKERENVLLSNLVG